MKKIYLCFLLSFLFLFCGCTKIERTDPTFSASPIPTESIMPPLPSVQVTELPSVLPAPSIGPEEQILFTSKNDVHIQYTDPFTSEKLEQQFPLSPDSDAFFIINCLNTTIFGEDKISVNKILYTNGNLFIDFTESIYALNAGSLEEAAILDAIAEAYFANLQNITAVYYTVDDASYASGHIEIPKDQPYKRNAEK